jgi:hypothetical protein
MRIQRRAISTSVLSPCPCRSIFRRSAAVRYAVCGIVQSSGIQVLSKSLTARNEIVRAPRSRICSRVSRRTRLSDSRADALGDLGLAERYRNPRRPLLRRSGSQRLCRMMVRETTLEKRKAYRKRKAHRKRKAYRSRQHRGPLAKLFDLGLGPLHLGHALHREDRASPSPHQMDSKYTITAAGGHARTGHRHHRMRGRTGTTRIRWLRPCASDGWVESGKRSDNVHVQL